MKIIVALVKGVALTLGLMLTLPLVIVAVLSAIGGQSGILDWYVRSLMAFFGLEGA